MSQRWNCTFPWPASVRMALESGAGPQSKLNDFGKAQYGPEAGPWLPHGESDRKYVPRIWTTENMHQKCAPLEMCTVNVHLSKDIGKKSGKEMCATCLGFWNWGHIFSHIFSHISGHTHFTFLAHILGTFFYHGVVVMEYG